MNTDYKFMKPYKLIFILVVLASILIPGYFVIYYWLSNQEIKLSSVLMNIFFSAIVTFSISIINYLTISYLQKKSPWQHNNYKRFLIELIFTSFNAALVISTTVLIFLLLFNHKDFPNLPLKATFFANIAIALIVNTIAVSIYEGITIFGHWKKALMETEQLKREKAESQYLALKNQVNPHFLFNSLNSLSSLIRFSPDKAVEFVDKFSKIYRYVLEMSDKMVVELREELDFLQSYYFLQKIRFGNNLEINININAEKLNYFVLPLSIQILIENAIKHNEISSDHPLKITVSDEQDFLVISNNLQQKINKENTTGLGLANLTERYKHLTDLEPVFFVKEEKYTAKIPLIKET